MGKTADLTSWLLKCPTLAAVWNISAEMADGVNVVLPAGSSERRTTSSMIDVTGCYDCDIKPMASVYETFQINCYRQFAENENDFNVLKYEEVESVINWIIAQDEAQNLPEFGGEKVVAVDCIPFQPQIRGVEPTSKLVCYYITIRVTYVNKARGRSLSWQM